MYPTYTRNGELVLARAGMQLAAVDPLSVNLVMQLNAQRISGPATSNNNIYMVPGPSGIEHAYGVSLGLEIKGPAAKTPAVVPQSRAGQWFVGADVGLTGTLNGDASGSYAWGDAAPHVGLDIGHYVTPSTAIVLDAADAKAINAA